MDMGRSSMIWGHAVMHTQFSDDLVNQTLTQNRDINCCKLKGACKRENVMARLGPSSECLSANVSRFSFPDSSQRLGEKGRKAERQEQRSSFIYGTTGADFTVVWWSFSWLWEDFAFPFSALGRTVCSWGVTRFHHCSELQIEATEQAVLSLSPAQGFVFMSFCIFFKSTEAEALHLIHLPATSNVAENSPPETSVHKFSVKLSASLSPVIPGFPLIINSSPLTEAFKVNWLSGTDFEVSTTLLPTESCHKEGSWRWRVGAIPDQWWFPLLLWFNLPSCKTHKSCWGHPRSFCARGPGHLWNFFSSLNPVQLNSMLNLLQIKGLFLMPPPSCESR